MEDRRFSRPEAFSLPVRLLNDTSSLEMNVVRIIRAQLNPTLKPSLAGAKTAADLNAVLKQWYVLSLLYSKRCELTGNLLPPSRQEPAIATAPSHHHAIKRAEKKENKEKIFY